MAASPLLSRRRRSPELEEHQQYNWGYSRPVVTLDVAWNLAFVFVTAASLAGTARERPAVPIRAWVTGYAVQCLIHVGFVCFEYRRRRRVRMMELGGRRVDIQAEDHGESWAMKKLESLNAMISMLWWLLGFYWIVVGGNALLQDAPRLYWLTVVFLAFDVIFTIFCVILACTIGIALCCCLPCIIAFLDSVIDEEGAPDAYLNRLQKFRFRQLSRPDDLDLEKGQGVVMTMDDQNSIADLVLPAEDTECCICLSHYEDGAELHSLPCSHHFHSSCIIKWLRINATCPLCKYNILEDDEHV